MPGTKGVRKDPGAKGATRTTSNILQDEKMKKSDRKRVGNERCKESMEINEPGAKVATHHDYEDSGKGHDPIKDYQAFAAELGTRTAALGDLGPKDEGYPQKEMGVCRLLCEMDGLDNDEPYENNFDSEGE